MTLRQLLKAAVPPGAIAVYRRLAFGDHLGYVWRGIYSRLREVPGQGRGFGGAEWLALCERYLRSVRTSGESGRTIPDDVAGRHVLLPLVVACLGGSERIRILDFGGGLAFDHVLLAQATGGAADVEFHIVESDAIVAAGRRLFASDPRVHFHDRLPASLPAVDLLNISTALQYVDDYPALLTSLIAYRPRRILMVDLPAGDIPTFATAQVNVRGSVIPSWFFNAAEIIALVESAGYRVAFKAASDQRFDLGNFPESHRLPRACHLLFTRVR
ncbi:MAG: methyltransferase, TIGR04325 family [Acidobacteriota bacterium]